jgi:hypothetical protein
MDWAQENINRSAAYSLEDLENYTLSHRLPLEHKTLHLLEVNRSLSGFEIFRGPTKFFCYLFQTPKAEKKHSIEGQ